MDNFSDLILGIFKSWYTKKGLLIALFSAPFLVVFLTSSIGVTGWQIPLGIIFFVELSIYLFWLQSQCPPKTPKDKVGFLISIACSNEEEERKLKEDLIIPLNKLIRKAHSLLMH